MAKIERLPGAAESQVEQPAPCPSCAAKDEELARLRARLHDPDWMIRRALALLSKMRGPALVAAAGAAVLLMLATWPLHGLLEGWLRPAQPPVQAERLPASSPTWQVPVPTGMPSGGPVASPPRQYGMNPPSDGPTMIMVSKPPPSPTPSPTLPVHPCSVTHGQPPQCQPIQ